MDLHLERTQNIIGNIVAGLLFIALTPTLLNLIIEIGSPNGRGEALLLGIYIGLALCGFVLLGLAIEGYRRR